MNEWLFLLHCLLIVSCLFAAIAFGKEALTCFVSLSWLFANFCVTKQILFFGFEVTASDMYAIGALLSISVIQERWGKKEAQKTVILSFLLLLFASLMSILHLQYTPSPHDTTQSHFEALLGPLPKLMIASLGTFLGSNFLEIILFSQIRRIKNIPFALSTGIITAIVALFDTALFTAWGLSGLIDSPTDVCLISLTMKMAVLLILTPFLHIVQRIPIRAI